MVLLLLPCYYYFSSHLQYSNLKGIERRRPPIRLLADERMMSRKFTRSNVNMAHRRKRDVVRMVLFSTCWIMSTMMVSSTHGFVLLAGSPSAGRLAFTASSTTTSRQPTPLLVVVASLSTTATSSSSTDTAPTNNNRALLDTSFSWDDLAAKLKDMTIHKKEGKDPVEPVLTLYRDTNGWCPFCERVWLCLEVKGIPYRERLINLRDKPEWYKELVPTTLVPAILLHNDDIIENNHNDKNNKNDNDDNNNKQRSSQRQIVWESLEIMQVLDDAFPETKRLVRTDKPEYQAAMEQITALGSAGFKFLYGNRNQTLTDSNRQQLKQDFLNELDQLDAFLAKKQTTNDVGPFLLGADFSAADACLIPTMERWRYQLAPPLNDILLDQGRPHVAKWFQAMDSLPAYANRVAGDCYSWTAVASTFARYFGGDEQQDESVQRMIQTADAAAAKLRSGFSSSSSDDAEECWKDGIMTVAEAAQQAAHKLIGNHEAVVADCTRAEPISQKELERAAAENLQAANAILLQVAHVLTRIAAAAANDDDNSASSSSWMRMAQTEPMHVNISSPTERAEAAKAARTVAARLCVPRDLGAPAAKILRGVLSITANRVEQQEA